MTVERYSGLQIAIHWAVALLVMANWFLSSGMEAALEAKIEATLGETPLHVWLGLAVLALMAPRVLVRLTSPVPGAPSGTTGLMATARHWGHILLYALLIIVPLGGAATWFFELETGAIHGIAGNTLMALAMGHACLALWHQGVQQDGTLTRMVQPRDKA